MAPFAAFVIDDIYGPTDVVAGAEEDSLLSRRTKPLSRCRYISPRQRRYLYRPIDKLYFAVTWRHKEQSRKRETKTQLNPVAIL